MKFLWIVLCFMPGVLLANDWEALEREGAVAIMRHALAPGTGDPAAFELRDCTTQRNLDDRGRAQARKIGAAFRDRGFAFDVVYTSQWCRTRETAEILGLGPVVEAPSLNSFFQDRSTRDAQTTSTAGLIAETNGRLMLVTHQVNISALTGRATRSGEVLIIRRGANQTFDVLGSILIDP